MNAQVKIHNGTPTLFLDGQPRHAGMQLLGSLDPAQRELNQRLLRVYAGAGIHIYSIDAVGPEWCGPGPGRAGHFDFTPTAPRLQEVIDADPQALFLLRMGFETRGLLNDWWNRLYPDELELLASGETIAQSFASTVWREEVKALLRAYIAHLRQAGLYERVIAYQLATGTCGEWIKDWSSMQVDCGDYSHPMRRYFRAWLRQRYQNDPARLRAAWGDPLVTFDSAEVPPAEMQMSTTHFLFRHPQREQRVVDFYQCYADLSASTLLDFCRTVKAETGGEKLAGAFFGYLMELSWNDSFFNNDYGTLEHAQVSTVQRSGHLGLRQVLRSPDLDFLVSPYGYAFRGMGGDGLPMQPTESLRVHGKLYLYEEDTLMHNNFDPQGRMHPKDQTIAIYQRNFAQVLTHGLGITWLETSAFMEDPRIADEAHAWQSLYQALGQWALGLDRAPCAETAVLLDDESFYYLGNRNNLSLPLVWQQRVTSLNRFGAPHDVYLLDDLLEGRLPPYKLYIFLNPIHLDNARRAALKAVLRREGRTALWIYAPGYLNRDAPEPISLEHMTDLTGLRFGKGDVYWGPQMHVTDFSHPITQDLPQDLFWGSTQPLGPVFHLEDPSARVLGQVIYSLGRCQPGLGLRSFAPGESGPGDGAWNSIYTASPVVPAPLLRGIARWAGVHLYNEQGDVLYATRDLLAVHTAGGGARTFHLPRPVEVVYDLYNYRVLARRTDRFEVTLPPNATALYFTGDQARLP